MPLAIALVTVVTVAIGGAVALSFREAPSPRTGAAPPIRLPDLRRASATVSLEDFRGRPVVVNFFASWCTPCRDELPLLRAAHERLGEKVGFLGIDHLDDADKGRELLDRYRVTYPAGFDPNGDVARRYRLRGLPSTVFIGADGRISGVAMGQLTEGELRRFLDQVTRAS